MNVLVIGGGYSKERDISLKSSRAVYEALPKTEYNTTYLDWSGEPGQLDSVLQGVDVVFPVLHGIGGEDGEVQKLLEKRGVAFVGTGSQQSQICIDKPKSKQLLAKVGVFVPEGETLDYEGYLESKFRAKSHVVKPTQEGSSVDTFIIRGRIDDDLKAKIKLAFDTNKQMLVEELIQGTEITVPVLQGQELPIIEIIPPSGEWFSYANKYNGKTVEACPPVNVDPQMVKKAQSLAKMVHNTLGARHYSRVDMIVRGNDLYVLEINTIPGMTSESLFPKAAAAAGMDIQTLVKYLVDIASEDKDDQR